MTNIKSLTGARIAAAKDSSKISPRDLLQDIIRRIDEKEMDITGLIVIADMGDRGIKELHAQMTVQHAFILAALLYKSTWEELREDPHG